MDKYMQDYLSHSVLWSTDNDEDIIPESFLLMVLTSQFYNSLLDMNTVLNEIDYTDLFDSLNEETPLPSLGAFKDAISNEYMYEKLVDVILFAVDIYLIYCLPLENICEVLTSSLYDAIIDVVKYLYGTNLEVQE